jgi:hypothetical protein
MAILQCAAFTKASIEHYGEKRDNGYWKAHDWANDKYYKCPTWQPSRLLCCIPIWIIKVIRKSWHWSVHKVRVLWKLPKYFMCIFYLVSLSMARLVGRVFGFDAPASVSPVSPFSPAIAYGRHRILHGEERSTPVIMCWTETAEPRVGHSGLRLRYEQLQHYSSPFHNQLPQYKTKSVDGEVSHRGPALAFFKDQFFLAWTDKSKEHRINIIRSSDGGDSWSNKFALGVSSTSAPALAVFNDRLHLAWRSKPKEGSYLNIISSADGIKWVNATKLGAMAESGPSLASLGSLLFVAWSGKDTYQLSLRSSQDGILFNNEVTLDDTTDYKPALGTDGKYVYLAWKEKGDNGLIKIARSRFGTDWENVGLSPLPAWPLNTGMPALASTDKGLIIGWSNPTLHIAGRVY